MDWADIAETMGHREPVPSLPDVLDHAANEPVDPTEIDWFTLNKEFS
jgi:hypothetical protein